MTEINFYEIKDGKIKDSSLDFNALITWQNLMNFLSYSQDTKFIKK
jgi:hypothetical protein